MKYNPDLHRRHSIRLQDYDYANAGAYFVTICCQNRINRFGEIVNNANNMDMDIVGAGFACPITQPDCPVMQPDAYSQNEQPGQADPAPTRHTVHTINLNEFGKIVDEQWQYRRIHNHAKSFSWNN